MRKNPQTSKQTKPTNKQKRNNTHKQNKENPQTCSDRYIQIRAECYNTLEITSCPNYFHAKSDKISKFIF